METQPTQEADYSQKKEVLRERLLNGKAFIFGLDGNLIDSIPQHLAAAEEFFRREIEIPSGLHMEEGFYAKLYQKTTGLPTRDQFKAAFTQVRGFLPNDEVANEFENKFNQFVSEKTKDSPVMSGVEEFLKSLKRLPQKPILIVATSHNIEDIPKLIKGTGLDSYLDLVLAQGGIYYKTNEKWETKPAKEGKSFRKGKAYFNFLKERYGLVGTDMVFVASAISDITKAKDAGCYTIGLCQIQNRNETSKLAPDFIYPTFIQLFEQFDRFEKGELENKAKVLILGSFAEDEIIGHITQSRRKTNPQLEQKIKNVWNEKLAENPQMYPGPMFLVKNWWLEENQLHLELGLTDFKEYVGTRSLKDLRNYGFEYSANPIGVSTALITADGKLVVAKRLSGDKTGFIDVIGGAVSPEEDAINGQVNFFHAAKRELAEELNFRNVEEVEKIISNMECVGLVYEYAQMCHPQLIFVAQTKLTANETKTRISEEIEPLIINLGQQSPTLKEVLGKFYPKIEPDGRIAMALAAKFKLGKTYQASLLRTPEEI